LRTNAQVNHSPSFTVDTPLDLAIKEELISDTIELVGIDPKVIKKLKAEEQTAARARLYGGAKPSAAPAKSESERAAAAAKVMRKREKYEAEHLGGYKRIYPPTDQPELEARYLQMLDGAAHLFRGAQQRETP
jgi:hypothetical protein